MTDTEMTEFDEFLRKRSEASSAATRDAALPIEDHGKEWQRLKDELRRITNGKALGAEPFEWSPYPAPYPDFLKLRDVAAVFATPLAGKMTPASFRIMFARRSSRADEVSRVDAPISAIQWLLTLEPADGVLYWNAKEPGLRLPTPQFAVKIAERLVEYFEEYNAALKFRYP